MTTQINNKHAMRFTCVTCERCLSSAHFSKRGAGLNEQCKFCISKYMKNYYKKNSEKIKARAKRYRENNKDKIKESSKRYYIETISGSKNEQAD